MGRDSVRCEDSRYETKEFLYRHYRDVPGLCANNRILRVCVVPQMA